MRNRVLAATAISVLALGMNSLPAMSKSGGGFGNGGGGGFGKSGGAFKSGGFHGKGFGKGHHFGKGGFKHAHRFGKFNSFFWGGWPAIINTPTNLIVRYQDPPAPPPAQPVVVIAQPKIFAAGTAGGCNVERVNVPQGTVNVYRC
jgi:hypothetical protein